MKVLFLDVDGVLNDRASFKEQKGNGGRVLSQVLLGRLQEIVTLTGCKIVLSSVWRLYDDCKKTLKAELDKRGLSIFDSTLDLWPKRRGEEIEAWLSERSDVEQFAILDDGSDANVPGHFFKTDTPIGLTGKIKDDVIAFLNQK